MHLNCVVWPRLLPFRSQKSVLGLLQAEVFRPQRVASAFRRFSSADPKRDGSEEHRSVDEDAKQKESTIVPASPPPGAGSAPEPAFGRRPPQEPRDLLSLPLFSRPHFPKIIAPIIISDPSAASAFSALREGGLKHVGLFLHKQAGMSWREIDSDPKPEDYTDPSRLYHVGVLAEVLRLAPRQKGVELTFLCHHRIRWNSLVSRDPLMTLATEPIFEPAVDPKNELIKAYSLSIIETMKDSLRLGSFYKEQLELLLQTIDVKSPYQIADLGACLTTAEPDKLQEVLEEVDLAERLRKTLALLKADLETTRVSRRIHKQIEENVSKGQRRYFLTEQLKQIKRELGMERDEKETLLEKFRARIAEKTLPEAAATLVEESMDKLDSLEPASPEYSVTRNHLDWLTDFPWGLYSRDSLDISRAEQVLDEMHYGLKDVKERILEFIAVSNLRGSVQGKILLLSGPPGVGKTSIAKSVAKALDRKFFRFSVGGMSDVAEMKGHRRTYVGAMPGKFVQALKNVQTSNPVICLDELDKTGRGWAGDPASALLEALDPEQNSSFLDHYLDTPIDLSKVLFICTANSLETIPGPLLDRMQNISLSGYILEEKVAIAERYLIPIARKEAGLSEEQVRIEQSAVQALARDYCREAGVRNLKNHVEKIFRKVALRVAKSQEASRKNITLGEVRSEDAKQEAENNSDSDSDSDSDSTKSSVEDAGSASQMNNASEELSRICLTGDNLVDFVGKPVFSRERLYEQTPPGIAMGLAWTSMGGATLYIETVKVSENTLAGSKPEVSDKSPDAGDARSRGSARGGRLKVTGLLGEVMRESTDIAWSYVRNLFNQLDATNDFFDTSMLHIHAPSGATPKDGPSAGCAMVSSMLSLAMNMPIRADLAMTGEITLTGKVLPVGGIREKAVAAKRAGVKHLILPEGNVKDWDELPDHVRDGLTVYFASQYEDDVLPVCFKALSNQKPLEAQSASDGTV